MTRVRNSGQGWRADKGTKWTSLKLHSRPIRVDGGIRFTDLETEAPRGAHPIFRVCALGRPFKISGKRLNGGKTSNLVLHGPCLGTHQFLQGVGVFHLLLPLQPFQVAGILLGLGEGQVEGRGEP